MDKELQNSFQKKKPEMSEGHTCAYKGSCADNGCSLSMPSSKTKVDAQLGAHVKRSCAVKV